MLMPPSNPTMQLHHLDHIGIKVSRLDDAMAGYAAMGFRLSARRSYETVGIEVAFLELGGHRYELLRSLRASSPIAAAPEGLHHVAFQCPDLDGTFRLMRRRAEFEVQGPPSIGAHGHPVFFFRVRGDGALFELVGAEQVSLYARGEP